MSYSVATFAVGVVLGVVDTGVKSRLGMWASAITVLRRWSLTAASMATDHGFFSCRRCALKALPPCSVAPVLLFVVVFEVERVVFLVAPDSVGVHVIGAAGVIVERFVMVFVLVVVV